MMFHHRIVVCCSFLSTSACFSSSLSFVTSPKQRIHRSSSSSSSLYNSFQALTDDEYDTTGLGDVQIPSTGVSVTDEMEDSQKDKFVTTVVPLQALTGLSSNSTSSGVSGVAQIVTQVENHQGSSLFEPHRYIIDVTSSAEEEDDNTNQSKDNKKKQYVMMDVPPFSYELLNKINHFLSSPPKDTEDDNDNKEQEGSDSPPPPQQQHDLAAICITNREGIHYDQTSAIYSIKKSDLILWRRHFPNCQVIGYRLDIPRDCRPYVTQVLDGYGPFATTTTTTTTANTNNITFTETGRPLTYDNPWDHDVAQNIFKGRIQVPEEEDEQVVEQQEQEQQDDYSPEAIRNREQDKTILAVYTPGYTFGSVSYVFPKQRICCSGYTIPIEDTREDVIYDEEDGGMMNTGGSSRPLLDCRGYITTPKAGIKKQMSSAKSFIKGYVDRFDILLPSRGYPLFMNNTATATSATTTVQTKKKALLDIIRDYEKIGSIYEDLGILTPPNDNDTEED